MKRLWGLVSMEMDPKVDCRECQKSDKLFVRLVWKLDKTWLGRVDSAIGFEKIWWKIYGCAIGRSSPSLNWAPNAIGSIWTLYLICGSVCSCMWAHVFPMEIIITQDMNWFFNVRVEVPKNPHKAAKRKNTFPNFHPFYCWGTIYIQPSSPFIEYT